MVKAHINLYGPNTKSCIYINKIRMNDDRTGGSQQ